LSRGIRCGRSSGRGRSPSARCRGRLGQGVAALQRAIEAGSELPGSACGPISPAAWIWRSPSARPPIQASKRSAISVRATSSRLESWATSEPSTQPPSVPPRPLALDRHPHQARSLGFRTTHSARPARDSGCGPSVAGSLPNATRSARPPRWTDSSRLLIAPATGLTAAVRPARRRWAIRPGRRPSPTP
jgi:hypothetical protein